MKPMTRLPPLRYAGTLNRLEKLLAKLTPPRFAPYPADWDRQAAATLKEIARTAMSEAAALEEET